MTTDPRVEAAARELHRLEYGGATDWDADGSLHSAFYLAAEAILAAAGAARVVPADVAGLVERLRETAARLRLLNVREVVEEAAAALPALVERAVVAEENDRISREYLATATARAETAERRLAVATEALKPFADDAVELADAISDDTCLSYDGHADIGFADFTVGDLRRARAALAQITGEARDA